MIVSAIRNSLVLSALFLSAAGLLQAESQADLSRLVVVGDSLSAGVQNFSLLDSQQPHGYASIIADQAKMPLILPLVPWPGAPNVLQLTNLNPVTIHPVPGSLPLIPRDYPCQQATNLSIPGVTLEQALNDTPSPNPPPGVQQWEDLVLAFPNAQVCPSGYQGPPPVLTQIQKAVALKPTTVIEYLGNNDALVPALIGVLQLLTPASTFATSYDALLDQLQATNATIITATIPDVTKVPYFTPVSTIAAKFHIPVTQAATELGVGPGDFLRPTAVPVAEAILSNQNNPGISTWPESCPVPLSALPVSTVPCVLTQSDAAYVQATIDWYNLIIYFESITHGATVVDIHGLVDQIARDGYKANGKILTTQFLGGLFSLDGVHPTNTGYAIIANRFIDVMNDSLGTRIPKASINSIAAHDPLVRLDTIPTPTQQ